MNKRQQEIYDELNRTFIARRRLKELLDDHMNKFGYVPAQYFLMYRNLKKDDPAYVLKVLEKTAKKIYRNEKRAKNR